MIETYKILRGLDRVDVERMFPLVGESGTREYCLKIKSCPYKTEMRRNLLRVVRFWNSLLQKAVETSLLNIFKAELDMFLISKGVEDY